MVIVNTDVVDVLRALRGESVACWIALICWRSTSRSKRQVVVMPAVGVMPKFDDVASSAREVDMAGGVCAERGDDHARGGPPVGRASPRTVIQSGTRVCVHM